MTNLKWITLGIGNYLIPVTIKLAIIFITNNLINFNNHAIMVIVGNGLKAVIIKNTTKFMYSVEVQELLTHCTSVRPIATSYTLIAFHRKPDPLQLLAGEISFVWLTMRLEGELLPS